MLSFFFSFFRIIVLQPHVGEGVLGLARVCVTVLLGWVCVRTWGIFFSPNSVDFLCCSRCAGHIIFVSCVFPGFRTFPLAEWPKIPPKPDSILMPEDA